MQAEIDAANPMTDAQQLPFRAHTTMLYEACCTSQPSRMLCLWMLAPGNAFHAVCQCSFKAPAAWRGIRLYFGELGLY